MKKILLSTIIMLAGIFNNANAQAIINVSGDITSNTTWTSNNFYILNGFVYVTNNAVLTIEPGTIIKGDKASKGSLIVSRGSQLIADGTLSQPIVFTSNEPAGSRTYGDWGGIVLCGKAPINDPAGEKVIEGGVDAVKGLYGGTDPADNSGILRYVRIEFPGIAFMPNNEINGLTCGGVGSSTIIDYVMVSYSGDDSYECFGGTVNMKHIIAYRGLDDDFDTDFGFSGKAQFVIAYRDSNVADISGSNGFESDNDATGTTNNPITHPIYSNVTIIGPMIDASTMINSNYKRGAHLRRSAKTSIYNSVITGYPYGLLIDGTNCETNATLNELMFRSNILAGCTNPLNIAAGSTWDISTWYNQSGTNNSILPNTTDIMLNNQFNYTMPDLMPQIGSPLLSGADFTYSDLSNAFFDNVTYRGAIGSSDWTTDWTNFDCQNSNYTISVEEITNNDNLSFYPNPANEAVNITLHSVRSNEIKVSIYDLTGRIVLNKEFSYSATGKNTITLNTENLSPGMYNLIVSDGFVKSAGRLNIF